MQVESQQVQDASESNPPVTSIPDEIRQLTIVSRSGEHFRLGDIADINESYQTPASNLMRIDGKTAVGIAISTVPTGNVVDMAEAIEARIEELKSDMPEGFGLVSIYDQGHESAIANQGFIINLIVSVITVVVILLFFIGFKNGLLIGSGLVFSIFATLIVMLAGGIALQRMSLAAIIIAMGMLVDNAIVVSDSALVNMQRGMRKRVSIMKACSELPSLVGCHGHSDTDIPAYLLFTTCHRRIIILSGYCHRCIAHVQLGICTDTNPVLHPRICTPPAPSELSGTLFSGKAYDRFRSTLRFVIRHRYATVGLMVILLVVSAPEFQVYPESLCTCSGETLLSLDVWLKEPTSLKPTARPQKWLTISATGEETEMISTYVGRTPPRYYLSNVSFGPQPNYAQLLVKARSSKETKALRTRLQDSIRTLFRVHSSK